MFQSTNKTSPSTNINCNSVHKQELKITPQRLHYKNVY